MREIKTIRIFYLIYTIYTLFVMSVSNYRFSYAFVGLFSLWFTFLAFRLGYQSSYKTKTINSTQDESKCVSNYHYPLSNIMSWPAWKYMVSAIFAWICAIETSKFYTGRGFTTVLRGAISGNSAYYSYQRYFLQSNIGTFSFAKIPYILMLAFLTIISVWSIISIVMSKTKAGIWRGIYLISVVLAYLYFGAARGTNFETYIVFIVFAYCFLQKTGNLLRGRSLKYLLLVFAGGILLIFVFRARIMDRGIEFQNTICPEITYNNDSFVARSFPGLVNIGLSLFGYLGYGIFCMGVTICDICFGSAKNMVGMLIPFGHRLLNGTTLSDSLAHTIVMGAKWTPDFINLVDVTGIILYIIVIILLGRFMKKIEYLDVPELLKNIIGALIFIEMLSIPVGNFLVASTSNELMLLFAIAWYLQYGRVPVTFGKRKGRVR